MNNLVEVGSTKPASNSTTTRVDENVSDKIRLFGTLTHFASNNPGQTVIPGPLENTTGLSTTTVYQTTIGYTHMWTPTFLSEMRFGFWRNNATVIPPSLGLDVASVLGIQRSVGPAAPTFNISSWSTYGLNSNTLRSQIDNNYQPSISATKVWRNHLFKFGWDLRKNEFNIYNPGGTGNSGWFTGNYSFTGEITNATHNGGNPINALADFLLGKVKTSGYALPQPPAGRRNYNLGAFVQDDWKVTPRLTLNLGVRYEYESPMTSSNNIYSRVDPATGQVLFAGINASASLNLEADKLNFAPRVGFAYSIYAEDGDSIRLRDFLRRDFFESWSAGAVPGLHDLASLPESGHRHRPAFFALAGNAAHSRTGFAQSASDTLTIQRLQSAFGQRFIRGSLAAPIFERVEFRHSKGAAARSDS